MAVFKIEDAKDMLANEFDQTMTKVVDDYELVYNDAEGSDYPVDDLSQGLWEIMVGVLKDIVDSVKADGTLQDIDKLVDAYEILRDRSGYILRRVGTLNDVIADINDADDLLIEFADANGIPYSPESL